MSLSSSGLSLNTTYYFAVAGISKNNILTDYTAAVGTATLTNIPLSSVSTFSAVTDEGFIVFWDNNSNPLPGTTYRVQVSTASNFNSGVVDQATVSTAPLSGPSYTFTGLTFSTVYYLRVRAENHNGVYTDYVPLGSTKTFQGLWINEVYPTGASAPDDWVELYNNASRTIPLAGWKLYYTENIIDSGETPHLYWTGQGGDVINAKSTFTVTNQTLILNGGLQHHVKLQNGAGAVVDQVQWPGPGLLSQGQSFARMSDGNPEYFEIDPTPTRNYANSIATDTLRINEVAYGPLNRQFVEIYNTSAITTQILSNYVLRNSNGVKFKFTRKIYPQSYTVLDFSSISGDGVSYAGQTGAFGTDGLNAAGDFLALENSTGSTVDQVTWESGTPYSRYSYAGVKVPYAGPAPVNAVYSIGRRPTEGADTDNDSEDFTGAGSTTTLASRNNTPGTAEANVLIYPSSTTASPQFLGRKFPITMIIKEDSTAGAADNIVFERTGGSSDPRSPHIYRLQDMGFDPAVLTQQTTVQTGLSFDDQDGYPLVSSAVYRVTFNTDTELKSAPQIILGTVTYDASLHAVSASTSAPLWMNNASRDSAIKLEIANNSPAGFNDLELSTVTFKVMSSDLLAPPLTTEEAKNLFNAIMLVRDSTTSGTDGVYESGIDVSTVAYVPMDSISLEAGTGISTLTVLSPGLPSASIPAASTGTFFLVFESTQDASGRTPKVFRVRLDPVSAITVRDGPSDLPEDFNAASQVDTSSITLIDPARPPANSSWPYNPPAATTIQSPVGYYTNWGETTVSSSVYIGYTDGYLRAVKKDGSFKWAYPTVPLSAIRTSPLVVVEDGSLYIYFANDNGDIYKVRDDNDHAEPIWSTYTTHTAIRSNLTCSDISCSGPNLYFGADDKKVYCLQKASGEDCADWYHPLAIDGKISGTISIDDRDTVKSGWVGLENGKIVALNTGDGTSPTSFDTPLGMPIKSSPYLDGRVASLNNKLYFTSPDGKLYARVSSNLTQLPTNWPVGDYNAIWPIYTSPFSIAGYTDYIYFGDDAGRLHKVDKTYGTSAPGWPFQAGGAIRSSPVLVPDSYINQGGQDYVYFGCDDGYVYSVSAGDGVLRSKWPVATGGPVRADLVIDPDSGTLVVGSTDGKTYVLNLAP
ncbi:MAG: hypothetical protein A2270_02945 [Elusimicrobia bacterium RIFOXYA12_FULL_51_18]|nr:MAG: hypothetical protein A2270_02945 [Elusimicrobia bacterium RIFOXYA12_FULL_51_18]OGS29250.1 MAG: hypothetical protein A2218_04790 [Elusimicrobia bacterium RIFOXYA2_FULL_53_38]